MFVNKSYYFFPSPFPPPLPFFLFSHQLYWSYQHHLHRELWLDHQDLCNQHLQPRHKRKLKGRPTPKGFERLEGQLKAFRPMMYPKPKTSYKSNNNSSNSFNRIITIVTILMAPPTLLLQQLLPLRCLQRLHKYNLREYYIHPLRLPHPPSILVIWNKIQLFPRNPLFQIQQQQHQPRQVMLLRVRCTNRGRK